MWMGGGTTDWYIGLLTTIDQTKIYDGSTFASLISQSEVFQEYRDYAVVALDDSLSYDKRILYIPDDYTLQTVDDQVTCFVDTNSLMRFKHLGTDSAYIVGMFLCSRESRDDEPCILYSVGQILPAVKVYPNDVIEVSYTPSYQ